MAYDVFFFYPASFCYMLRLLIHIFLSTALKSLAFELYLSFVNTCSTHMLVLTAVQRQGHVCDISLLMLDL